MNWFRYHSQALDNIKIQSLSGDDFKNWVNLMCVACSTAGALPAVKTIAFKLRISLESAQEILNRQLELRLVDLTKGVYRLHDWETWQYISGDSAKRMRRHREKKRYASSDKSSDAPCDVTSDSVSDSSASVSVSVSVSELPVREVSPQVNSSDLKPAGNGNGNGAYQNGFSEFLSVCLEAGLPMGDRDQSKAEMQWKFLDFEQKLEAVKGVVARMRAGEYDDPAYRPMPHKYLEDRAWTRPVRKKITARESTNERAKRKFMEGS